MLTTHLHLVAQPRVGEATPPFSHPSLRHAQGQLFQKKMLGCKQLLVRCVYFILYILYMIAYYILGDDFITLHLAVPTVCVVRTVVKFITGW